MGGKSPIIKNMKCADPILSYQKGTTRLFRHYSLASPFFKALHTTVLNCGKCLFCRKKRSKELAMRCVLHASLYTQNSFLTLTYDEKKQGYHNEFNYKDIQDFKKRLRRHCQHHYGKRIQIFNVHEYGKNGKKHWHLVLFNHDFTDKKLYTTKANIPLYTSDTLSILWPHGYNTIGDVTEASAMYQAQYTQKDFKYGNANNQKKSHSKHAGIGRDYFMANYAQILGLGYIPFNGQKVPIPRYFEKLAHKHYSHYYAQENFFDNKDRKALYRPFKNEEPNIQIADLYKKYVTQKEEKIIQFSKEFNDEIEPHIFTKTKTKFQKSAENYLHDQTAKINKGKF